MELGRRITWLEHIFLTRLFVVWLVVQMAVVVPIEWFATSQLNSRSKRVIKYHRSMVGNASTSNDLERQECRLVPLSVYPNC